MASDHFDYAHEVNARGFISLSLDFPFFFPFNFNFKRPIGTIVRRCLARPHLMTTFRLRFTVPRFFLSANWGVA